MRALVAMILCAAPVAAQPFLAFPVDCQYGETCVISDYMDIDPGPGALDYTCGQHTRDDHRGVDIAPTDAEAMRAGIDVLAAAPGVVEAIRDEMPDQFLNDANRDQLRGRDCGNAVRIGHADGYQTLYCHLKRGSVTVRSGQRVAAGEVLGEMGYSGATTHLHLHISVLKDGARVDPFAPDAQPGQCGTGGTALWRDRLDPELNRAGLLSVGFTKGNTDFQSVKTATAWHKRLAPTDNMLLYAHGLRVRRGDVLRFTATGPTGEVFDIPVEMDRDLQQMFRSVGRRAPEQGWPPGRYRGGVQLLRNGQVIAERRTALQVR